MGLFDGVLAAALTMPQRVQGISGLVQTQLTSPDEWGCFPFDLASFYPGDTVHARSIIFRAVLNATSNGQTASLELYDKTDGASIVTLVTPANTLTPTLVQSSVNLAGLPLTSSLPTGLKLLGLRLFRTGGSGTDYAQCKFADLFVTYSNRLF